MNYDEMSVHQRAEHLLRKGVVAKIGLDLDSMKAGWGAYVEGMLLPVGSHESEQAAIDAGTAWLESKLSPSGDASEQFLGGAS